MCSVRDPQKSSLKLFRFVKEYLKIRSNILLDQLLEEKEKSDSFE